MQFEFRLFDDKQAPAFVVVESEEWKALEEFPKYEVSSFGRFRNKQTGRYMRVFKHENGYQHIGLVKNGKQLPRLVHRLVAQTFLEQPSSKHSDVNHKNKIRDDNRLANLEWSTRSQNNKHARAK